MFIIFLPRGKLVFIVDMDMGHPDCLQGRTFWPTVEVPATSECISWKEQLCLPQRSPTWRPGKAEMQRPASPAQVRSILMSNISQHSSPALPKLSSPASPSFFLTGALNSYLPNCLQRTQPETYYNQEHGFWATLRRFHSDLHSPVSLRWVTQWYVFLVSPSTKWKLE